MSQAPAGLGTVRTAAVTALVVVSLAVSACGSGDTATAGRASSPGASRLAPEPARLAGAPPDLRARLAASPIAYFRFVNQAWTREVCRAFAADLRELPTARIHGDAHIEQYAVTANARGLDDFDDSARGPAVVDMVRFLGSVELTSRERRWEESLPRVVDAFFEGYRRALDHPDYLPPDPVVVKRLRAAPIRSPQAFLGWADSLMDPLTSAEQANVAAVWPRIEAYAARANPEFTPAFLQRKTTGRLHLGIGSALTNKILIRVEGPSPASDDDVVLEGKEVISLRGQPCLTVPKSAEVYRVVEGLGQLGRIRHRLVLAVPALTNGLPQRGWWLRTWDRSYRELEIPDLRSGAELAEVAYDVGAQLGGTNLVDAPLPLASQKRLAELEALTRLESRIRGEARDLTRALLETWQDYKAREASDRSHP